MDKGFLEDCLAKGMSLEAIGQIVGKHPSTVGHWLTKHELNANGTHKYAARGGLDREVLEAAVEEGLTLNEMAAELDRSVSTIRYWLARFELQATGGARRREARVGRERGLRYIERHCLRHGMTRFILENRGSYRCMKCRQANVVAWRRRTKRLLVEEAGGKCLICGYDRYPGALQFHHLDPTKKSFGLAMRGYTRSISELRAEAAKCRLLCANCHAEVEGGFATLPIDPAEACAGR